MMTWKQFKEAVEAAGVGDDDDISYIDISGYELPANLNIKHDTSVEIWN